MMIIFIGDLAMLVELIRSIYFKLFVPEILDYKDSYYLNIFPDPIPNFYLVHQCLVDITGFLIMLIIVLSHSYFAGWCYLSYICFDVYELKLKRIIQSQSLAPSITEELRLNFEECLKLAVEINKYFSVFLGFTFACFITEVCSCIFLTASGRNEVQLAKISLLLIFTGLIFIINPPIISNSKVGEVIILIIQFILMTKNRFAAPPDLVIFLQFNIPYC